MDLILLVANLAASVILVAFILIYWCRAEWWRSPHGRSIMSMKMAVLLVAIGGLLRRLDHDGYADKLLVVGWAAVAVVMAWRTWMLWHDTARIDREAIRERLDRIVKES